MSLERNALSVEQILSALVKIPSVNPELATDNGEQSGEHRLTDWIRRFCEDAQWPYIVLPVHSGRANVLALASSGDGGVMLWDAHQDTVAVEGMSVDPFEAANRDGKIYGRGACDVKGGMAAMLCAASRVSKSPAKRRPSLLLSFTVNEECGFSGARSLAALWDASDDGPFGQAECCGLSLTDAKSLKPSRALVAEPTDLNVVTAHRGVVRWRCRTHGRAAHSSRPELGVNAVYGMAGLVDGVRRFNDETLAKRRHASCGTASCVVTTIHGGLGANTIPDLAAIDIDRRLLPDESPEGAYDELIEHLRVSAEVGNCRVEHLAPWMQSRGLSDHGSREWAECVVGAARSVCQEATILGAPYGTNAASIALAGIPTVVFGPGSIKQAHTADEWIS
ncbi:MAG: M20/M25/M40 family metallo-hydrolase, partial [Planctomycetota bacterium]